MRRFGMELSKFGQKFTGTTGIGQLMDDLGKALSTERSMLMLGGGNPAHIPAVQDRFRQRLLDMLSNGDEFERTVGNYDTPQGKADFIAALAELLRNTFGWDICDANIALTHGSQNSFFFLFNMLAGRFEDNRRKKILLPLTPEYIGYTDIGLEPDFFAAAKPGIEFLDDHLFKYRVNFENLPIEDDIGAICVSRPTNPTGNVVTDKELKCLQSLARQHHVPLIIDNAYGTPFPGILFVDAEPVWDENTIMCMSLSKLGLPALRTGIVIASPEIIRAISSMNAVLSLAPSSMGAALAMNLVRTGEIIELGRQVIKPYYQAKAQRAVNQLRAELDGVDYWIHAPEGAIFLWLWVRDLPISDQELYERLKERGVLVVPGHYFFPGVKGDWPHERQCIRVTYAQDEAVVSRGLSVIAETVKRTYAASRQG